MGGSRGRGEVGAGEGGRVEVGGGREDGGGGRGGRWGDKGEVGGGGEERRGRFSLVVKQREHEWQTV